MYATMAVEFFEVSAAMAPYAEPKERLAQIQRSLKDPQERVQRFGAVIVGGRESVEVVYDAFSWPPHSYAAGDRVATTEWEVYIKDGDVVYGLAYASAREDFDEYAPLFRRLLQTFRLQR